MNIEQLKCFILVAENLSFARAAEALYISQPAVTKQIHALEQELGAALLIRSTRHVELTSAGMSFYRDAKDIVSKAQQAVSRVQRQSAAADSLRIGLSSSLALAYLTPLLAQLHRQCPQVRPNIEVLNYKIIRTLFLENKLDVLFYYRENLSPKAGICFQELARDRLSCLMPAEHPLGAKEEISIADLEEETIIACNPLSAPAVTADFQQRLLERHCADTVLYCDGIEIAHCMVAAGMGVTVLPALLSRSAQAFALVPLAEEPPLSYGVFYHKKNKNPVLQEFLRLI